MKINKNLLFLLFFTQSINAQFNQIPETINNFFKQLETTIKNLEKRIQENKTKDRLREQQIAYLNNQLKIVQNKLITMNQNSQIKQQTTVNPTPQKYISPTNITQQAQNISSQNSHGIPQQPTSIVRFRRK